MSIKYIHTPDAHACLQQTFIETVIQGWGEHKSLHSEKEVYTHNHTHIGYGWIPYTHMNVDTKHTHMYMQKESKKVNTI